MSIARAHRTRTIRHLAGIGAALALSLAAGCATDDDAPVVSESAAIHRLDYSDGSSIEFRPGRDGTRIVATAGSDPDGPLAGLSFDGVTPAELYESLTASPVPLALTRGGAELISFACGASHDFCLPDASSILKVPSSERVDRVVGGLHVHSGRVRLQVFSSHAGQDRQLLSTYVSTTPAEGYEIRRSVPTSVDRHMRVEIDEISVGTSYSLWLDFQG